MPQQQPSAKQEGQIVEWISKELSSGTVVRKDLIHWYTRNVLRRDSGGEATLGPEFADDLLHRHPDLAKRLVIPSPPSHVESAPVRLNRLEQRMQQDRRQALFGDSPPPPRQRAPYPEGEIIYRCNDRYAVRPPKRLQSQSTYWHQITTQLGAAEIAVVFTHGDIAARNILVRDGRVVALLDWEFAGWCPAYWDYVFALRGLDNLDWETLGLRVPELFEKRYDLEYILLGFILTLS